MSSADEAPATTRVVLSIGSNMGDRLGICSWWLDLASVRRV